LYLALLSSDVVTANLLGLKAHDLEKLDN